MDVPPGVERFPLLLLVTAQNGGALRYVVELRRAAPPPPAVVQAQPAQPLQVQSARPAPAQPQAVQPQPLQPQPARPAPAQPLQPQAVQQQPAQVAQPEQQQPAQSVQRPQQPSRPQPPANPPVSSSGPDHVVVSMQNLALGNRETAALLAGKDAVGKTATITVRPYRSSEILGQDTTAVQTRQQGHTLELSLQYRTPGVTLGKDRLVEIEIAIPTTAGRFLVYKEAVPAAREVALAVPFLLYSPAASMAWPAIGSPVQVGGYVSMSAGHAEEHEAFQKNAKNEYGIGIELVDAKTGRSYGADTVWRKPGLARGQSLAFTAPMGVPEGSTVRYAMTARAANGREWTATGQAEVWTTRLRYEGGFQPVLLPISDELALSLSPSSQDKEKKPEGKDKSR